MALVGAAASRVARSVPVLLPVELVHDGVEAAVPGPVFVRLPTAGRAGTGVGLAGGVLRPLLGPGRRQRFPEDETSHTAAG